MIRALWTVLLVLPDGRRVPIEAHDWTAVDRICAVCNAQKVTTMLVRR